MQLNHLNFSVFNTLNKVDLLSRLKNAQSQGPGMHIKW